MKSEEGQVEISDGMRAEGRLGGFGEAWKGQGLSTQDTAHDQTEQQGSEKERQSSPGAAATSEGRSKRAVGG